jgi:excalibur calcium-binding domain-containing protein
VNLALRKPLLVCLASLAAASVLVLPATASAADKDCADFKSQRAAQFFFLKHGGPQEDPDRLDGDNDGVACEDNPCPCYRRKHLPYALTFALAAAGNERLAAWNSSMLQGPPVA